MKRTIVLLTLSICLFSCKDKKEDIIAKKWRGTTLTNLDLDSMVKQQQVFIDTVGKSTGPAENIELYGLTNIDSLKQDLQNQLDSFRIMQEKAVKNTVFDFSKDSIAVINFGTGINDSCKWYFDEEGSLVLVEKKVNGIGDELKMEVIQLTDTILQLKFSENGSMSTITFKPEGK